MKRSPRYRSIDQRLNLVAIGANVCGAVMIMFYFNNLHFSGAPDSAPDAPLNLGVAGLLTVAFLVFGNLMSDRILRPLWEWYLQDTAAAKPEKAPLRVRGLALNMPAISAGVTLSVWFLAGLVFGVMRSASTQPFNWSLFSP